MDFTKRMAKMRDAELVRIVYSHDDEGFTAEAISAARSELALRNVSAEDVLESIEDADANRQYEESKANLPLSTGGRVLFFVFASFLVFVAAAAFVLSYRGYKQKARDAGRFVLYGWLSLGGIAVMFLLMDITG